MKKWIAFTLCICMLALAGCGKTEEKKDLLVETASGRLPLERKTRKLP